MHAKTVLDQHIPSEQVERNAKTARDAATKRAESQRAITAAHRAFEAAFRSWQSSRPEYKAFHDGIKAGLENAELERLAALAGCPSSAIYTIRAGLSQLPAMRALAAQHSAAKKELAKLEKEFTALEEELDQATTHGEIGRLEDEIFARRDALGAARRHAAETEQAQKYVAASL